eukprot:TRINITY_DN3732_c0_g1_i1.p1 TRINITY_DN3732_c0_g1~~TRINITY_DN3732_c0_g1_i1.p1  ORF type:complete len:314 (-),score=37.30 TRINITY_DN3732_c0_g1_i1:449-1390(-)
MRAFQKFPTNHEDLIHDIAYDYYGKRLATCSSDQTIKVWDLDDGNNWKCTSHWKAHNGSILKVAWAHPEFGQILASGSIDRTVSIWEDPGEEIVNEREKANERGEKKWLKRSTLLDSRGSICDIKFGPKHLGLKLATCSFEDGFIRIYEAPDITNLSHWPLTYEVEQAKVNCISWNPSFFGPPRLVGGIEDGTIKIWEFDNNKWSLIELLKGHQGEIYDVSWAPNLGRSYHLIASASKDTKVGVWKLQMNQDHSKIENVDHEFLQKHDAAVWRVEWNITGTLLASSGDDNTVLLWRANPPNGPWRSFAGLSEE